MVAVVSVFAAAIFITAVLLIIISLHMSQNLNPKGESNRVEACTNIIALLLVSFRQLYLNKVFT
jgi:hypothetical protein